MEKRVVESRLLPQFQTVVDFIVRLVEVVSFVAVSKRVIATVSRHLFRGNSVVCQMHPHRAPVNVYGRGHVRVKPCQRKIVGPAIVPRLFAVAIGELAGIAP